VSTYALISDLPLTIESHRLERREHEVSTEFTRVTTTYLLAGGGEEGAGEDVTYDGAAHDQFEEPGAALPLAGDWTIASFSDHLEGLDMWPEEPGMEAFRDYRRWAFESAALDLALRQAGKPLGELVGREPRPVRFVVSMRLGEPSSIDPVKEVLALYPDTMFKLDALPDWTPELFRELVDLGVVDSIDLKGQYAGTVVDNPPNPGLYRTVAETFPEAWIEDPALTDETDEVLRPYRDRITWDAPIHSVADIESRPFPPRMTNIKPSRFGSLRRLFDGYDYCEERGIGMYGGGQFELGVGRGQIQYLASLFHPDTPNDTAPGGYNFKPVASGLPTSPLEPVPHPAGFRWG
jgi:hypothetical protein